MSREVWMEFRGGNEVVIFLAGVRAGSRFWWRCQRNSHEYTRKFGTDRLLLYKLGTSVLSILLLLRCNERICLLKYF